VVYISCLNQSAAMAFTLKAQIALRAAVHFRPLDSSFLSERNVSSSQGINLPSNAHIS
jgi:hypothetical protein